jgi:hypothetical protein
MPKIHCPACDHTITVDVTVRPDAEHPTERGPINDYAARPLRAFLRTLGAGKYPTAEIQRRYRAWAGDEVGAPELGLQTLSRTLRTLGYRPYRTADHRGFHISEPEGGRPAELEVEDAALSDDEADAIMKELAGGSTP